LNELEEQYKSKGLSIIGVTSEGVKDTEKWVAEKGAKYAYGYDKGGKLAGYFKIPGQPHAVLLDPSGKVVWDGHPGGLSGAIIEKALVGALPKLPWEWDAALQPAAQLLGKRQFAKAIAEAQKAGDAGTDFVAAVQGVVKSRVAALQAAKEAGDFLSVSESATTLAKELDGLPEEEVVSAIAKEVAGDKEAQKVIAGQKQVRDLSAGKIKKRDLPGVLKKLEKIKTDLAGTQAARDAEAAITMLKRPD
jgi:hypothetical protein